MVRGKFARKMFPKPTTEMPCGIRMPWFNKVSANPIAIGRSPPGGPWPRSLRSAIATRLSRHLRPCCRPGKPGVIHIRFRIAQCPAIALKPCWAHGAAGGPARNAIRLCPSCTRCCVAAKSSRYRTSRPENWLQNVADGPKQRARVCGAQQFLVDACFGFNAVDRGKKHSSPRAAPAMRRMQESSRSTLFNVCINRTS